MREVPRAGDRQHGSKDLFARDRGAGIDVREQRRLHKPAVLILSAREPLAACQRFSALLELGGTLGERGHEAVVDRRFDNRAGRCRALLAGGEEGRVGDVLDRAGEVGVSQHDGRVLAAHLELNAQPPRRRFGVQLLTDAARAGEGDRLDLRRIHQRVAQTAARPGDEVHHAFRDACVVAGFDDPPGAQWRGRGRLHNDGVAANQRRSEFPRRDGAGEVPGRDHSNDADRLA